VAGILFFLLVLIYLTPPFLHYQIGFILVMVDIAGAIIPMYFLWKGIASIFSGLRPVTIEEVKQLRYQARRVWYLQASGVFLPDRTFRKNIKIFLIESGLTISGGLILLLHILNSMLMHSWAYILLLIVVGLVEYLLVLDILYLAPKQTRDLPIQSVQELSRLFINGETTTGEKPWE
jgi:hypothetical protein